MCTIRGTSAFNSVLISAHYSMMFASLSWKGAWIRTWNCFACKLVAKHLIFKLCWKQHCYPSILWISGNTWTWCLQVHEKTIIFPLLPVTFLANQYPALVFHNHLVATYSMGPLLVKDELMFATLVVIAVFINCMYCLWKLQLFSLKPFGFCTNLMYVFMTLLAIVAYLYTPPDRFPYLWDAAVMVLSFPTFFVSFVYMHKLSSSLWRFFFWIGCDTLSDKVKM